MNRLFHFKQFSVDDSACAMKTGTDAVLLGAMAASAKTDNILDIGTGSGIIALMLAQRFPEALIDAVEIDTEAAGCAAGNFHRSHWHQRLKVTSMSIQEYTTTCKVQFDLIVTNPPFFTKSLKNDDPKRSAARHDDSLPLSDLLQCSGKLLKKGALLWMIIPAGKFMNVMLQAAAENLFLRHRVNIFPVSGSEPKRCILSFSKEAGLEVMSSDLIIYERNGIYSDAFRNLCREFYMEF